MRRLLREPLLHFLIIGAVLFGVHGWLKQGPLRTPNEIVVTHGQIRSLQAQFERAWQRPPTSSELQSLIDSWLREEIFYREGLMMGLDRDDPVVRHRIAQKIEFIVDGAAPEVPTVAQLQSWLDAHADTYAVETTYSLRQVYFDPARHGDALDQTITAARAALRQGNVDAGDATMLPATLAAPAGEIRRIFGSGFEAALRTLPVGGWQGPVLSGFGVHLVELRSREPGRKARLTEVRDAVERDLLHARAQEMSSAFYERLKAGYDVRIDARVDDQGIDAAADPSS
jgi:hypothetical protein